LGPLIRILDNMKSYIMCLAALIVLTACATANSGVVGSDDGTNFLGQSKTNIQDVEGYVSEFPDVGIDQVSRNVSKDIFNIGDTADISVYNVESLTNTYIVDRNGNIVFPLIGEVRVAGLSTVDLQAKLVEKYGARYLRNPGINVKREATELGRIVVDGAVNKPGVFEVNDIIKLSEAIALAEGLNGEDTNGSSVYIIRNVNGDRKVREVDLRNIRRLGADDPQLIPDDVVFVQDSAGRIVFREFLRTVPLLNTATLLAIRR